MIKVRIFTINGQDFFSNFQSIAEVKKKFKQDTNIWFIQVYDRSGYGMIHYENESRKEQTNYK
jgi:hypothetical protein